MRCYVCNSEAAGPHKSVDGFPILRCRDCGLMWVEEVTDKDVADFYSGSYFRNPGSVAGYADYLGHEGEHRRNARELLKVVRRRQAGKLKVLDIGCAHGFLLDEARRLGWDGVGVELSEEAVAYATGTLGLDVRMGDVLSLDLGRGSFDVVFLVGSIEHLRAPRVVLGRVKELLQPGGIVILTTIDTQCLLPFYSLKPPEHLFYFSHHNIRRLLEDVGFRVSRIRMYFVHYMLSDLCLRLANFSRRKIVRRLLGGGLCRRLNWPVRIPTNEMLVLARPDHGGHRLRVESGCGEGSDE